MCEEIFLSLKVWCEYLIGKSNTAFLKTNLSKITFNSVVQTIYCKNNFSPSRNLVQNVSLFMHFALCLVGKILSACRVLNQYNAILKESATWPITLHCNSGSLAFYEWMRSIYDYRRCVGGRGGGKALGRFLWTFFFVEPLTSGTPPPPPTADYRGLKFVYIVRVPKSCRSRVWTESESTSLRNGFFLWL